MTVINSRLKYPFFSYFIQSVKAIGRITIQRKTSNKTVSLQLQTCVKLTPKNIKTTRKVNNKDTRVTLMTAVCCLFCQLSYLPINMYLKFLF